MAKAERGVERREFMRLTTAGVSTAWVMARWPEVLAAAEQAKAAAQSGAAFKFFAATEAAEIEAIAAQIIPNTDGTPGAREAGVVHFIDRALVSFERSQQSAYRKGLAEFHAKLRKAYPGKTRFASLPGDRQIEFLKGIETTEFFKLVRTHTVMGFFANPEYGGNRSQAGWKLIGLGDEHVFSPPFGEYDRDYVPQK